MRTVTFNTLGCKVNQYETQAMREQFIGAGFNVVSGTEAADVCVINTCTVTRRSDAECRRLIRNAIRRNPGAKVVVAGCYAESDREEIRKISEDILIINNSEKDKLVYLLKSQKSNSNAEVSDTFSIGVSDTMPGISGFSGRTKAFIKIQEGCDNFCSYCKVPLVRGRSRSRPPDRIIPEIKRVVLNGYKEIVLTGICLGDWGRDMGLGLPRLLDEIERSAEGEFRVRLSSVEPWYVSQNLLEKVASTDMICKHLHIPMQSGDDEVLKKMNRRLKSGGFAELINRLRVLMPEAAFTTDMIVGFPGETEEQFRNTLKTVEMVMPVKTHIFPFSMRAGTKAELLAGDQVPARVVKERISRLKHITDKLETDYKNAVYGKTSRVLVETQRDKNTGLLTGFTDTYVKVLFQGSDELRGKLTTITTARSG